MIRRPAIALVYLAVAQFSLSQGRADTWDRGAGTNFWSVGANWADNTEPTSADPVIFPTPIPGGASSISLSNGEQAQSITFNRSYSLDLGNITLSGVDGPISVVSGRTASIHSSILGSNGLLKGGDGTLVLFPTTTNTFTGDVKIAGTLRINKDASLGNAANAVFIGTGSAIGAVLQTTQSFTTTRVISPGIFGGTIGAFTGTELTINSALGGISNPLTFNGAGTVVLNAVSTRNGSTSIQTGTVQLNNGAALGVISPTVSNSGKLDVTAGVTANGVILNDTGTLRTTGAGAIVNFVSVGSGFPANVTLYAGDNATHTLTIGDFDGGAGSTTSVNGSGTIILSGAGNDYAGAWAVDSGTLRLTHSDAITSSLSPIVINSGGTVIAETASNYAGAWTVGGLLRVLHGQGTGTAASNVNVNSSGTLQIEGVDFVRNATLNNSGTLRGNGSATASGTITAADTSQLTLLAGPTASDVLTVNNYAGGNGSTTQVLGNGLNIFSKDGTVYLPNPSTYAGDWGVGFGTLRIGHASALGVGTSAVSVGQSGTLLLDSGVTFTRDVSMTSAATLKAGPGGFNAFVSGTVSIAPGAIVYFSSETNGNLTVAEGLTGGGGGSAINIEAGSRVNRFFSPASSYVGAWNVYGAGSSLTIKNDNQLGDPANPLFFDLGGRFIIDASTSSSRVITIGNDGGNIFPFGTLTLNSGMAGGSGSLFIGGSGGGLVLNAASSRTGPTVIDRTDAGGGAPVVRVNNNTALGVGTVQVGGFGGNSTAELQLGDGVTMNQPATLVKGTIRGNSNSTYAGTITAAINAFTDVFLATGGDGSHTLTVASYAGGNLADTHITGSGKVILSGANSYNGAYVVDGGTLRLTHASAISTAVSPIEINSGGTVEAAVASNYAGDWLLNGGTLRVQHADGLGTGTSTIAVGAGSTIQLDGIFLDRPVLLNDGGTLASTSNSTYSESGFPKVTNAVADVFLNVVGVNERLTIGSAIRSETVAPSGATIQVNGAGRVVLSSGGTSAADVFGGSWELSSGILQVGESIGNSINGLGFKNGDAKQANTITVNGGTLAVGVIGSGSNTPPWLRANVTLNGLGAIASTNGVDAQYGGDFIVGASSAPRVQLFDPVALATVRSVSLVAGAAGPDNLAAATTWGAGSTLIVDPGSTSGGAFTIARSGGTISVGTGAALQINPGATVNLGGAADALSDGTNHVRVVNNSSTSFNVTQGSKNIGYLMGTGNTNISAGATLTVHQSANTTYGDIIGGGALIKDGAQSLTPNSIAVGALTVADGAIGVGAPLGTATIAGSYTQTSAGTLLIDLGSLGFDQLLVGGAATLAGDLDVSLIDSFTLAANQEFLFADIAGALSGQFAGLNEGALVGNFGGTDLFITYAAGDGNDVALFTAPSFSAADFDEDFDVDGVDLTRWRTNFGTGTTHLTGDADGDADADGNDFLVWQRQVGSGMAVPAGEQIPEPGALTLISMAICCAGLRAWPSPIGGMTWASQA